MPEGTAQEPTPTLTITDSCASRIKTLRETEGNDGLMLRIAVSGGGCSGFEYVVDLVKSPRKFDMPSRHDKVFVSNGARVLIDKKSLLFLEGTQIDWAEQEFGHSFTYENPNAKGICGCGTSFSV